MRQNISLRLVPYAAPSYFRALHVSGPDGGANGLLLPGPRRVHPPGAPPLRGYFCDPNDARRIPIWRYGWRASMDIPNAARNARGEMELDLVAGVEGFERPILFLCGECDSLIDVAHQQDHLRHFPTARLQVIRHAGHSMFTDNPEASVGAVRRYLDEVGADAAAAPGARPS